MIGISSNKQRRKSLVRPEVEFTRDSIVRESMEMLSGKKIVIDVGGKLPFYGLMSNYRDLFTNSDTKYYSLDLSIEGKPHIQGDILELPFANESVDGLIVLAVLEHVSNPWQAVCELYRVLKRGGVLFMYVPFLYPYHSDPHDYFRFTHDGIIALLPSFSTIKIQGAEGYICTALRFISGLFPWGRGKFGVAYKLCKWHHPHFDRFAACFDRLIVVFFRILYGNDSEFEQKWYSNTSGYNVLAIK